MINRLKNLLMTIGVLSLVAAPLSITAAAYADNTGNANLDNSLACGSNLSVTAGDCGVTASTVGAGETSLDSILRLIVNIFSAIVGFIAVIMIIIGGVRYITSGGESGNISGAKNTVVYAIVGLVIVALAQVIVHFVLQRVAGASSTSGAGA